jgi:ABC-type transport system involved in cytochrome c biogenesis ATPase subunit
MWCIICLYLSIYTFLKGNAIKMISVINLKDPRIKKTDQEPLSFTISPSEAFALKGPNGCGKTSLLRMIIGIIEPEAVQSLTLLDAYHYLPSTNALYKNLKVKNYIHHSADEDWKHLMEKSIQELSSGQMRKLSLSVFFKTSKKIWIMDEPTTHLDQEEKKKFYHTVETHCTMGGSVLISSHDDLPIFIKTIAL